VEVAAEIARAATARLPERPKDLAAALRKRLGSRPGQRQFTVVIDALDEAASPAEARLVAEDIAVAVTQTCAEFGAQVVVGTRRRDDAGDLLARLGPDTEVVGLDAAEYFAEEDLAAYALATLQQRGDERVGNPYADRAVAALVTARIAALAQRNFLVAGLVAGQHGLHDTAPADPRGLAFPADVEAALAAYLRRLPPVGPAPAGLLLTALAYAQSPGLTTELWSAALAGLGVTAPADELARFAAS
jgi:hypothetical protein